MKVFIVDNGSTYIDDLVALFANDDVTVLPYATLKNLQLRRDDFLVLSGGHGDPVL